MISNSFSRYGQSLQADEPERTFAEAVSTNFLDKETNRSKPTRDILALFEVLHADTRLTQPPSGGQSYPQHFDVDVFLRWLLSYDRQNWTPMDRCAITIFSIPPLPFCHLDSLDNNHALTASGGMRDTLRWAWMWYPTMAADPLPDG